MTIAVSHLHFLSYFHNAIQSKCNNGSKCCFVGKAEYKVTETDFILSQPWYSIGACDHSLKVLSLCERHENNTNYMK